MLKLLGEIWTLEIVEDEEVTTRKAYGDFAAILEDDQLSELDLPNSEPETGCFECFNAEGQKHFFNKIPFFTRTETKTITITI